MTNETINMEQIKTKEVKVKADEKSYFDGSLSQIIGYCIIGSIVTIFTLGLCFP